jgi:hypothetical protein
MLAGDTVTEEARAAARALLAAARDLRGAARLRAPRAGEPLSHAVRCRGSPSFRASGGRFSARMKGRASVRPLPAGARVD